MKRNLIIFIQIGLWVIGLAALTFLLWEPHLEGRNVNATVYEIYFKDPFLAYVYIASIPFFIGLYKMFQITRYAVQGSLISEKTTKALRTIKYSALSIIGFVIGGEIIILLQGTDDHPPAVMMGLFFIICSITVAMIARKYERVLGR